MSSANSCVESLCCGCESTPDRLGDLEACSGDVNVKCHAGGNPRGATKRQRFSDGDRRHLEHGNVRRQDATHPVDRSAASGRTERNEIDSGTDKFDRIRMTGHRNVIDNRNFHTIERVRERSRHAGIHRDDRRRSRNARHENSPQRRHSTYL